MFNRILVAIDQSEAHRSVFETALALAKLTEAQLMLLHILSIEERPILNLPMDFPAYSPTLTHEMIKHYQEEWAASEQRGLDMLRSLTNEATAAGVPTEFTQTTNEPSRGICDAARSWQADLIVIGRRGVSGLNEAFLGSVSNYVLHHAPCSVLTVQGLAPNQPETLEADETIVMN